MLIIQTMMYMKKKRKKNHWTSKNTHLKHFRPRDKEDGLYKNRRERLYEKIVTCITFIIIFLLLLIKALDNRVVGYDHFTGIPSEWIKWLK